MLLLHEDRELQSIRHVVWCKKVQDTDKEVRSFRFIANQSTFSEGLIPEVWYNSSQDCPVNPPIYPDNLESQSILLWFCLSALTSSAAPQVIRPPASKLFSSAVLFPTSTFTEFRDSLANSSLIMRCKWGWSHMHKIVWLCDYAKTGRKMCIVMCLIHVRRISVMYTLSFSYNTLLNFLHTEILVAENVS